MPIENDQTPTIVIEVSGGVVQNVSTNHDQPARVILVDYDSAEAGGNEDLLLTIPQEGSDAELAHAGDLGMTLDPGRVRAIANVIDAAQPAPEPIRPVTPEQQALFDIAYLIREIRGVGDDVDFDPVLKWAEDALKHARVDVSSMQPGFDVETLPSRSWRPFR